MMTNQKRWALVAGVAVGLVSATLTVSAQIVAYSNAQNNLGYSFAATTWGDGLSGVSAELGDQIILSPAAYALGKGVVTFSFEYFLVNPSGNSITADVRFYANNGPSSAPGSKLWDSGAFPVTASPGNVLIFNQAAYFSTPVIVPNSFTWTVQFYGLSSAPSAPDTAGPNLYSPPTVGSNYQDYWLQDTTGWHLLTYGGSPNIDFGAVVVTPEPATGAMAAVFGLGALLFVRSVRNRNK